MIRALFAALALIGGATPMPTPTASVNATVPASELLPLMPSAALIEHNTGLIVKCEDPKDGPRLERYSDDGRWVVECGS